MKLIFSVLLIVSAIFCNVQSASVVKRSDPFQWRSCSSVSNSPLVIESLAVSPLPVLIPGSISLSMRASNSRVIENMDMQLTVWKLDTWFGDIRLPCLMGHGSCKHKDVCQLVQDTEDEIMQLAQQIFAAGGVTMECPIQPNNLTLQNYEMMLPELPNFPFIGAAIAGEYKVKILVTEPNSSNELSCYEVQVKVEEAPEPEEECTGWFCW